MGMSVVAEITNLPRVTRSGFECNSERTRAAESVRDILCICTYAQKMNVNRPRSQCGRNLRGIHIYMSVAISFGVYERDWCQT